MKIKIYSLSRSGHHAISFWLAKNIVPAATVDFTYEGGKTQVRMVEGDSEHILDLEENEHIKPSNDPTIIILRDPYNNYASFLRLVQKPEYGPLSFFPFMSRWKEYAQEAVGETNVLTNKIIISYNDWVDSEEYRKSIVKMIGKKFVVQTAFDDSLKNKMTRYGGGSSFDGLAFFNEANKMKVHERYKSAENIRSYREKVDTPEIKGLADKIFKFYPWTPVEKKNPMDMRSIMDSILG